MAAKTTTQDNIRIVLDALDAELSAGPREIAGDDLAAYMRALDAIVTSVRAVKKPYARKAAVLATQRSRQARKAREAELAARVAELEAQIATA